MARQTVPCADQIGARFEVPKITEREFADFRAFIEQESGIYLRPEKKALLVGRLARRLRELNLSSFGAYYRTLLEGDASERRRMIERICTHETSFFREPRQFEWLERWAIPAWQREADAGQRSRRIRVWSAGCSTGEEPYSLAMLLLHHLPPGRGWAIEIIATDLSTRALEDARVGTWPLEKRRAIPPKFLKRFMLKGTGGQADKMKAGPEIRARIRFQPLNLNGETYSVRGHFDLILCRNVLMYFTRRSKSLVVDRLLDRLASGGFLLLGHAEGLFGRTERVRCVMPTVYTLAEPFQTGDPRLDSAPAAPEAAAGRRSR
jgi:chemotaxis protein methyltransferase CheR